MDTQHGNGNGDRTHFSFTRSTTVRWAVLSMASIMAQLGAGASAEPMIPAVDAGAAGGAGRSGQVVSTDPAAGVATEDTGTEPKQTWVCPPCPTP